MRGSFKLDNPGEMRATLTLTMTLDDWRKLHGDLRESWPSCDLRSTIFDLFLQAEKQFYPKAPADE